MGIFDALKKKKSSKTLPEAPHRHDEARATADKPKKAEKAEKAEEKAKPRREKRKLSLGSQAHAVLIYPHVSEKTAMAEAMGQYTFVVTSSATKGAVRQAVKEVYGTLPKRVRIVNVPGRDVRMGRWSGRRGDWKKAIVTMPKGQSLDIHEGV